MDLTESSINFEKLEFHSVFKTQNSWSLSFSLSGRLYHDYDVMENKQLQYFLRSDMLLRCSDLIQYFLTLKHYHSQLFYTEILQA